MGKTGDNRSLGTAEGALMGRAAHSLHAESPILDDPWAVRLLAPETRKLVHDPNFGTGGMKWDGFDTAPLFALNIGALRYAEDEVERSCRAGIAQYVILGAGFDTFALRRSDLCDRLRVYEVDHPDVQALKRRRIDDAEELPASMPIFVPVDFERTSLRAALAASGFESTERSVFSWMNTLPYLSADAIEETLHEIAALSAPGSRLVLNYACDVAMSREQRDYLETLESLVLRHGEPMRSGWKPEAFERLLDDAGFSRVEHISESELAQRYFAGRRDGLVPTTPARLVIAERRG
ncbi:MAG: SAM-dependent methyltransferase [Deltaproteobacteria bacterium]|jgi:methyltransferase (TIGR00027 family)|nr:SAM-dependent methyltransferase [Deltaproteobacteria bacterium]MBW2497571.1 SAM-dependent methyltransferase [Deltaproteobacteria bacterium]